MATSNKTKILSKGIANLPKQDFEAEFAASKAPPRSVYTNLPTATAPMPVATNTYVPVSRAEIEARLAQEAEQRAAVERVASERAAAEALARQAEAAAIVAERNEPMRAEMLSGMGYLPEFSQGAQKYIGALRSELMDPDNSQFVSLLPQYKTEAEIADYLSKPMEQNLAYKLDVTTSSGDGSGGDQLLYYNTPVVLYDDLTGEVVYAGVGFEAAREAQNLAENLSFEGGKKASWQLLTGNPGETDPSKFTVAAKDTPDKSFFDTLLDVALPAMGAFILPGIGGAAALGIGSAATAGVGAGLGSALSGTLQGKGIGDILKDAVIAGASTLAGGELIKGIGGASSAGGGLSGTASNVGADLAGQAAGEFVNAPITVIGSQLSPSVIAGGIGGALTGTQLSNALSNVAQATQPPAFDVPVSPAPTAPPAPAPTPEIVVTGSLNPIRVEDAIGAIIGGAGIGDLTRLGYSQAEIDAAIKESQARTDVVEAEKPSIIEQPIVPPVVVPPVVQPPAPEIPEGVGEELVVEAEKPSIIEQPVVVPPLPPAPPVVEPPAIIEQPEIVVEAEKPSIIEQPIVPPVVVPPVVQPPAPDIPEGVGEEIVVEAEKPPLPPIVIPPSIIDVPPPQTVTPEEIVDEVNQDTGGGGGGGGLGTLDYIRLGLLAPSLIEGVVNTIGGGGGGNVTVNTGGPLSYTPLNRQRQTPGFDVFTYGQRAPGAQQAEYEFFGPQSIRGIAQTIPGSVTYQGAPAGPETIGGLTAEQIAQNALTTSRYQSALTDFGTYQNTLAQQVAAGTMTPAAAQAAAQQYASGLGFQTEAPAPAAAAAPIPQLAKGGEVEDSEPSDDMVKHLLAYQRGEGHMGPGKVSGIGSGQEDLIPAWLSDGEYVWSAQDVADLGDGSTDEGVRRLDKMREMVRKGAGRKNVKKIAKPQQGVNQMLKAVGGRV